jgi:hypothetical protein
MEAAPAVCPHSAKTAFLSRFSTPPTSLQPTSGLPADLTITWCKSRVNPLLNLSLISGNLSWVGIVLCSLIITSPAQAFALVVAGNLTHDMARDAMAHARSGSLPGTGWLSARTLGNFGGFQTPKGVEAATRSQALSHFQSK